MVTNRSWLLAAALGLALLAPLPANAQSGPSLATEQPHPSRLGGQDGPRISFAPAKPDGRAACTITVPVKITRLHKDVQTAAVICGVWPDEKGARAFDERSILGKGLAAIPLKSDPATGMRSFDGSLSVPVKLDPPKTASPAAAGGQPLPGGTAQLAGSPKPGKPTHWACGLTFQVGGDLEAPSTGASHVARKPSGTFVPKVSGRL
jgi:hypothetical protein